MKNSTKKIGKRYGQSMYKRRDANGKRFNLPSMQEKVSYNYKEILFYPFRQKGKCCLSLE